MQKWVQYRIEVNAQSAAKLTDLTNQSMKGRMLAAFWPSILPCHLLLRFKGFTIRVLTISCLITRLADDIDNFCIAFIAVTPIRTVVHFT
jgi:hypothetical protein